MSTNAIKDKVSCALRDAVRNRVSKRRSYHRTTTGTRTSTVKITKSPLPPALVTSNNKRQTPVSEIQQQPPLWNRSYAYITTDRISISDVLDTSNGTKATIERDSSYENKSSEVQNTKRKSRKTAQKHLPTWAKRLKRDQDSSDEDEATEDDDDEDEDDDEHDKDEGNKKEGDMEEDDNAKIYSQLIQKALDQLRRQM
jgi:hypothetical protein